MRSRFSPEPGSHCVVQAGLSLVIVLGCLGSRMPNEGIKLRMMGSEGRTCVLKELVRELAESGLKEKCVTEDEGYWTEDTVRC